MPVAEVNRSYFDLQKDDVERIEFVISIQMIIVIESVNGSEDDKEI